MQLHRIVGHVLRRTVKNEDLITVNIMPIMSSPNFGYYILQFSPLLWFNFKWVHEIAGKILASHHCHSSTFRLDLLSWCFSTFLEFSCTEEKIEDDSLLFPSRMKNNIVGMEANMDQLLEKVYLWFVNFKYNLQLPTYFRKFLHAADYICPIPQWWGEYIFIWEKGAYREIAPHP